MANLEAPRSGTDIAAGTYVLGPGTLISAAIAACLAQVALAIPAVPPPSGTPSRPRTEGKREDDFPESE